MSKYKRVLAALLQEMAPKTTTILAFEAVATMLQAQSSVRMATVVRHMRDLMTDTPQAVGWVLLSEQQVAPIHVAVRGLRVRIVPTSEMLMRGYLDLHVLQPFCSQHEHLVLPNLDYDELTYDDLTYDDEDVFYMFAWDEFDQLKLGDHVIAGFDAYDGHIVRLIADTQTERHVVQAQAYDERVRTRLQTANLRTESQIHAAVLAAYVAEPIHQVAPGLPWTTIVEQVLQTNRHTYVRDDIQRLQVLLREQRIRDSEHGLWDGMAPRYSAARIAIDTGDDAMMSHRMTLPPIDTRLNHTDRIEEAIAQGLYDVQLIEHGQDDAAYDDDDDDDADDDVMSTMSDDDDALWGADDYLAALRSDDDDDDGDDDDDDDYHDYEGDDPELMDAHMFAMLFANRHPALEEMSLELLQNLTASERKRIVRAESDDDYNAILSAALQRLLPHFPHFMQTLRPTTNFIVADITDGGQTYAAFELAEYVAKHDAASDALHSDHDNDVFATGGEAVFAVESALRDSEQLIEHYVMQLTDRQMSAATIRRKRAFVYDFAVFMARYYTLSLHQVTYAHLDEYVFFYFPRHTRSGVPRTVSDMIRAIRECYRLQESPATPQQRVVANAIYERRHAAEEVLRILVSLPQYSFDVTALVVHLFAPYTA